MPVPAPSTIPGAPALFASALLAACLLPPSAAANPTANLPGAPGRAVSLGDELGSAVQRFVSSLDDDQRDDALYDFEDDERFDLRLAPLGLEGLTLRDMSEAQQQSLSDALGEVLSPSGMQKVDTIRSLEHEVGEMEGGIFRLLMGNRRDPKLYYLAIFGEPRSDEAWGLRFDGHHLSLNWTAVPGRPLSVTPLFLGGQPRVVPDGFERAGLRALADEEEQGLALGRSLDAAQRKSAELSIDSGSGLFMNRPMFVGAEPVLVLEEAHGLARSEMSESQRLALDRLVSLYVGNFDEAIAERHREQIARDGDRVRFAFAGSLVTGEPSYYRIQGPSFLIEFDNTDASADHIHVVWRDLAGDFGRDLLTEHHRAHH